VDFIADAVGHYFEGMTLSLLTPTGGSIRKAAAFCDAAGS
jgi:hypothetical protein